MLHIIIEKTTFFCPPLEKLTFFCYNLFWNIIDRGAIRIKKNSAQYKVWIKRRNQKNLALRTLKKAWKKARLANQSHYNETIKKERDYNPKKKQFIFSAPPIFSFIKNTNATSEFFADLIGFVIDKRNFGKSIYIDISKVKELTIDALMYLLSIVNNLSSKYYDKYRFSGNSPIDYEAKQKFMESGFFRYVKHINPSAPLIQQNENVQIVSGTQYDREVAKKIASFVSDLSHTNRSTCSFIYVMMIELMSNTFKHAYGDSKTVLNPHWYCYADYDKDNTISFTFMDTGDGIPATVRKKVTERLDIFGLIGDDKYVTSALDGEFRTATKQAFRGKGLPKIKSFCTTGKIKNLRVITNNANVEVQKASYISQSISTPLKGTLYYWEIDINDLKGEKYEN